MFCLPASLLVACVWLLDDPQAEAAKLRGKWRIVSVTYRGKAQDVPDKNGEFPCLEIYDDKLTFRDVDVMECTFRLVPSTRPKSFVFANKVGMFAEIPFTAIYKLEAGKLIFCYSMNSYETPDRFESDPGRPYFLYECERLQ